MFIFYNKHVPAFLEVNCWLKYFAVSSGLPSFSFSSRLAAIAAFLASSLSLKRASILDMVGGVAPAREVGVLSTELVSRVQPAVMRD